MLFIPPSLSQTNKTTNRKQSQDIEAEYRTRYISGFFPYLILKNKDFYVEIYQVLYPINIPYFLTIMVW